ncbi:hypothetical protein BO70DRAFT_357738 [Aspergillus heteromorphus CBS 117.55]|uniref:Uncharacterized protein n=1 Tax=Aspergillus heteromorphus CBS 117.55 TaxID=1448321 RepID=A0A317X224_9EURO|nr:uncharacterized protein BO70DRAFT_357738 [Aspergillus heteromorphus CBS 117.55]PWY92603.1 hypothetical protein BO70DRAFT_357738 [Aspergillus heteromorphus CBS 117.55]
MCLSVLPTLSSSSVLIHSAGCSAYPRALSLTALDSDSLSLDTPSSTGSHAVSSNPVISDTVIWLRVHGPS